MPSVVAIWFQNEELGRETLSVFSPPPHPSRNYKGNTNTVGGIGLSWLDFLQFSYFRQMNV